MPDPKEISRYCSSLVAVVSIKEDSHDEIEIGNESKTRVELQLAHFSVQEYLKSSRLDSDVALDFQECHAGAAIAKVCLSYLLQFMEEISSEEIVQQFPFVDCAARYWITNAARARDTDNRTLQLIEQLFCFSRNAYKVCYNLYKPDQKWYHYDREPVAAALYYAALGGLLQTVKCLFDRGADVNAQGGYYGNALQAASYKGHEQIVRLLVEKGADVNAQGGDYGNALQAASYKGHEQIVRLLVEKGALRNIP